MAFVHARQLQSIAIGMSLNVPEHATSAGTLDIIMVAAASIKATGEYLGNVSFHGAMEIRVVFPGVEMAITVWPFVRIAVLKQMIWDKGAVVPVERQRLYFTVYELEDTKTIADYHIRHMYVLTLVERLDEVAASSSHEDRVVVPPPPPLPSPESSLSSPLGEMQVFVDVVGTGMIIDVMVSPYNEIRTVKMLISMKTNIVSLRQRLIFNGGVLQDAHTLQDYGVCDGCVLMLKQFTPRVAV